MLASKSPPRSGVALSWDSTFSFDSLPAAFGPFRVLHQLGAGVLGPVFRATDESGGSVRAAAVKLFVFDFTPERASECARLLQRHAPSDDLHPSLVRVVSAGCEGSLVYLAQDYVSGVPLDALLRDRGPLPAGETLALLRKLAAAIDAAAAAGTPHGRLHPRDVLVSLPNVWITGHGVASTFEELGVAIPARRPYTAPERQGGQTWDVTADVYSLAAIAYEMISGRRMGATGDAASLASLPLEPAIRDVLSRAMAADPGARYSSASGLVEALESAMAPATTPLEPDAPIAPAIDQQPFTDLGADMAVIGVEEEETRRAFPWRTLAAMVTVGVVVGYGSGYLTGLGVPGILGSLVPQSKNTGAPVPSRDYTEGTVAEPPKPIDVPPVIPAKPVEPEAAVVPEPPARVVAAGRAARTAPVRAAETSARAGGASLPATSRGTLAVRTRPEGARVFLNGRAVGVSPLVLTDVAPGAHRVGLELAGYQSWTSLVRIGSGTRHSVTASLDRLRR